MLKYVVSLNRSALAVVHFGVTNQIISPLISSAIIKKHSTWIFFSGDS